MRNYGLWLIKAWSRFPTVPDQIDAKDFPTR